MTMLAEIMLDAPVDRVGLAGEPPAVNGTGRARDPLALLGDRRTIEREPPFRIEVAGGTALADYRALRGQVFVAEQGMFDDSDLDRADLDPRTVVLVARDRDDAVIGGVRLGPATPGPDVGWWRGGRLAVARAARGPELGVGAALVRAACAYAETAGALRFEATVQVANERFFERLGWTRIGPVSLCGRPHVLMRWPVGRVAQLVTTTKSALGGLLAGMRPGGPGFVGDDGAPVPGTGVIAACDAILPSMVERDPEWAGWCGVLVNLNDLAAMGAVPLGLLDCVAARDASFAARILAGLRRAADAYGVPVLGGHTQLGAPASLSVTGLGRTATPVRGGGGRPGDVVSVTADLGGTWRAGYRGSQWDSASHRETADLRAMLAMFSRPGAARPTAAKDVSMAGIVGTLGMLAEASGCGAVLEVARVPRPRRVSVGDWFTCFPGFAMVSAHRPGQPVDAPGPTRSAVCGHLVPGRGVGLLWPDGEVTPALSGPVTGLGVA